MLTLLNLYVNCFATSGEYAVWEIFLAFLREAAWCTCEVLSLTWLRHALAFFCLSEELEKAAFPGAAKSLLKAENASERFTVVNQPAVNSGFHVSQSRSIV